MKVGIRMPNVKNRVKSRTTARAKRAVKRSVNPLYGKKGMGFVNNPKKAVYNKVYKKTTIPVDDLVKGRCNLLKKYNYAEPIIFIRKKILH